MTKDKEKIHPLGDRVAVRRLEAAEKTAGGIVLPDQAREKPKEGIIVAVGRGRVTRKGKLQEPQVKANDRVIFSSWAGSEVTIGDEELLILREDDILAVVE